MKALNKSSQIKFLLHVLLWAVVIIFVIREDISNANARLQFTDIAIYLFSFLCFAIVSYFNIWFLIPRFFIKKKYFLYSVILLSAITFCGFLLMLVHHFVLNYILTDSIILQKEFDRPFRFMVHMIFSCATMVVFTSLIYIIGEWMRTNELALKYKEAEKEKIAAELKALKGQINPHFLFNTLNNLYSLSLEKSDKTPVVIVKLSELMSYILYECKSERVQIKNELEFISNYIELEQFRFEDRLNLSFTHEIDNLSLPIAPLLFIVFIENAFKHGFGSGKNEILIHLQSKARNVYFCIENSATEANENSSQKKGVGIENAKRRLNILYPNRHELLIKNTGNRFRVELRINTIDNEMPDY